jgi:hypothetical protein
VKALLYSLSICLFEAMGYAVRAPGPLSHIEKLLVRMSQQDPVARPSYVVEYFAFNVNVISTD